MKSPLWIPSEERKTQANITRFIQTVNRKFGLALKTYADLYRWSVDHVEAFWGTMWEFADIRASQRYTSVVDDLSQFPGAK